MSTIGSSIKIKGEIIGAEDILIEGELEGQVSFPENMVVIGESGKLEANVSAKVIKVNGQVSGDLHGKEQVVVHASGHVRGNIVAPRVTLEDGAKLKGTIDMDPEAVSTLARPMTDSSSIEGGHDEDNLGSGGEEASSSSHPSSH